MSSRNAPSRPRNPLRLSPREAAASLDVQDALLRWEVEQYGLETPLIPPNYWNPLRYGSESRPQPIPLPVLKAPEPRTHRPPSEGLLGVKLNEFVPRTLLDSPKHLAFFMALAEEVLYAGVAGSGKSEALLCRALKYVEHGDYRCLILRKQQKAMKKSSGLYQRMLEHLGPWIRAGIVVHKSELMSLYFPSGAIIEFSYLGGGFVDANQGLEYTTVMIDEITQNAKTTYDFWWTRLRRLKDQKHLPIQLLCAGNPGGIGNKWVVRHWGIKRGELIEEAKRPGDPGRYQWYGTEKSRLFLESELADNPALDIDKYEKDLDRLDPIRRKQIKFGDWSAEEDSRYKTGYFVKRWVRTSTLEGPVYTILDQSNSLEQNDLDAPPLVSIYPTDVDYVFTTVDVACSIRTGVNKTIYYESTTREIGPSYSVASTWAAAGPYLLLIEVNRIQAEAPQVVEMLRGVAHRFPRSSFHMEENGVGKPTMQFFEQMGFPVLPIKTTMDKVANSLDAQQLASELRVILPVSQPWLPDFIDELTSWFGHPDQTDDQVDTLSNAAKIYGASPLSINPRQLSSEATHLHRGDYRRPRRPIGSPYVLEEKNEINPHPGLVPLPPTSDGFADDYSFRSLGNGRPVLSQSKLARIIRTI